MNSSIHLITRTHISHSYEYLRARNICTQLKGRNSHPQVQLLLWKRSEKFRCACFH